MSSFDAHPELLEAYEAAYPDATPSLGVVVGFGMSELMKQVLDAACENGDLTRAGVFEAFDGLEEVDTGGLVVPIRGFETGKSPSLESFVLQPADVPGGASVRPRRSRVSSRRRSPADPSTGTRRRPLLREGAPFCCPAAQSRPAPGGRQQADGEEPGESGGRRQRHGGGGGPRATTAMTKGTAKPM